MINKAKGRLRFLCMKRFSTTFQLCPLNLVSRSEWEIQTLNWKLFKISAPDCLYQDSSSHIGITKFGKINYNNGQNI